MYTCIRSWSHASKWSHLSSLLLSQSLHHRHSGQLKSREGCINSLPLLLPSQLGFAHKFPQGQQTYCFDTAALLVSELVSRQSILASLKITHPNPFNIRKLKCWTRLQFAPWSQHIPSSFTERTLSSVAESQLEPLKCIVAKDPCLLRRIFCNQVHSLHRSHHLVTILRWKGPHLIFNFPSKGSRHSPFEYETDWICLWTWRPWTWPDLYILDTYTFMIHVYVSYIIYNQSSLYSSLCLWFMLPNCIPNSIRAYQDEALTVCRQ